VDIVCLDFEGILVPEIWINVAARTGIDELRLTTRDVSDYDVLMRRRLAILKEHGLGLPDIQAAIAQMGPLEGAEAFVAWLRERFLMVLLSDTYYEFAAPFLRHFCNAILLCHRLAVDECGTIVDYVIRQPDSKRQAVRAFRGLNYRVIAVGDSYNDVTMLAEADAGILFRPPENVVAEFPRFPVTRDYAELREALTKAGNAA